MSSSLVAIAALLLSVSVLVAKADHRPNHFGTPCTLCKCFVQYTDRDLAVPDKPYKVAEQGYETTEDRCLVTCLRDKNCKAVVYGMSGGREVFACEFYGDVDPSRSPFYVPFINTYMKRSERCNEPSSHIYDVATTSRIDEAPARRKAKYRAMADRQNPFNFG